MGRGRGKEGESREWDGVATTGTIADSGPHMFRP